MKELLEKMQDTYETFKANATLQLEKQNKAAGTRARKDSLILEKLAKEFRTFQDRVAPACHKGCGRK